MDVRSLTRGIRAGNEAAFDAFYASYADRMYRYLLVAARGDEERARDVLQDALLRVIRYAQPIDTAEDLWRWLAALMRSALIDRARRDGRDRSVPLDREPASEERASDLMFTRLDEALAALPAVPTVTANPFDDINTTLRTIAELLEKQAEGKDK